MIKIFADTFKNLISELKNFIKQRKFKYLNIKIIFFDFKVFHFNY